MTTSQGIEHRLEHYGPFKAILKRPQIEVLVVDVRDGRVLVEGPHGLKGFVSPGSLYGIPPLPPEPPKRTVGAWILERLRDDGPLTYLDLVARCKGEDSPAPFGLGGALAQLSSRRLIRSIELVLDRPAGGRAKMYHLWEASER